MVNITAPAHATATTDANEAVASVAYRLSETIAIYPITPSSAMAESCDEWAAHSRPNLWGDIPRMVQMQSEAGVAGAIHGMLLAGSMSTTFTASQGLLLMIPNMYKIAGELLPFCLHVTARTIATHALSIFGDHSDVMACRQTGFAMLSSGSVQEAQDMALIAHAATLESRIPFLHFFDGFRTSHEIQKIETLDDSILSAMINPECVAAFRARALTPDRPSLRGSAQNPDVYFQAREACNPYYEALPSHIKEVMGRFGKLTGRNYDVIEYSGDPEATRVIVIMGSGAETVGETVKYLNEQGEKVGVLQVRLFRPFPAMEIVAALPKYCRSIAVLDRTKEPGAIGDPLYLDILATLAEARSQGCLQMEVDPIVVGGRYGLSSKEFTPAMAKAVFDNLLLERPKNHFTVGINDDVTGHSLPFDESFDIETPGTTRAVFFGLGSDGTVGANKNSIKIIGGETSNFAQGYFVYDSKKSGAVTISHLRFGPDPIKAPYLISRAGFIACHQWALLDRLPVLDCAARNAVLLINSPYGPDTLWDHLSRENQEQILQKGLRLYCIDAYGVARASGMGGRINTIMQTCFFALSGVLPRDEAITRIKDAIRKSYKKKGEEVIHRNFAAVDQTLAALREVPLPKEVTSFRQRPPAVPKEAPDFVQQVTAGILEGRGDLLPVSAFSPDGTWPTATSRWEKRNIAREIPAWDPSICIQCNKCVLVCPHAAIRAKFYDPKTLKDAPAAFQSAPFRSQDFPGTSFTIQVAPEDCTGCSLCTTVCPAKDRTNPRHKAIDMVAQQPLLTQERENFNFFLSIPEADRASLDLKTVKASQFLEPLFEFSGACAGCGETPYIKLLTQLYGDRLIIANATGCSSIYGGNLPTTPYTINGNGRGPAWANSLFEDNAEFGLGIRMGVDLRAQHARRLLAAAAPLLGDTLVTSLLEADQKTEAGIRDQRLRVEALKASLHSRSSTLDSELLEVCDYLVKKSIWIIGGDGWAYDIGFGGLDHVLSGQSDINILVLDTQVYSNTGGQQSKATPLGAVAKFAANGKKIPRKQLGVMAMGYQTAYVASVAMGAKDGQTLSALVEAGNYVGPSLVIAYSHCIAHGYNLSHGMEQQKLAVDSGFWPLYRFDPSKAADTESALRLDTGESKIRVSKFLLNEARFRMLQTSDPVQAAALAAATQQECDHHGRYLRRLAEELSTTKATN
jgi:pyruvate-ferredoxin/flavodoxin oxidoreductase